jgi:hypothetical protein
VHGAGRSGSPRGISAARLDGPFRAARPWRHDRPTSQTVCYLAYYAIALGLFLLLWYLVLPPRR